MGDDRTEATIADPNAATISAAGSIPPPARARSAIGEPDDIAGLVDIPASHYRATDEIARGGMGRVRIARDRRLARWVAIKDVLVEDPDIERRFEREVRITARLQHPSIVSVYEAGRWSSGRPFYAMPLVKGRSLDTVIAEARSLADRLALIPRVIAVADAMAYAHGERVIHRDLKPSNVLVGAFGETVVIDWGVAKSLDEAERPSARSIGDRDVQTVDGAVIGTPAYMPPEQALGGDVDERADVYAVGALLAHVLAGKPPYTGGSTAEVLAKVISGPPLDVGRVARDVPRELLAIVARAMAREPAARYRTARELAEDLKAFQTGQLVGAHRYSVRQLLSRWARRHRTALGVAALGVAALAVVAAITTRRIVEERARAEANRADADQLADTLLSDMHDRLLPLGRLDLLDEASRAAAAHYASLDADETRDEATRHAKALANIADVTASRNDLAGARALDDTALARLQQIAGDAPADRELLRAIAHCQERLASYAFQQRDVATAKRVTTDGLATVDRLLAVAPGDVDGLHDRAALLQVAGVTAQAAGDLVAAREDLTRARAIGEPLVRAAPDNITWGRDLADTERSLSKIIAGQGDGSAAIDVARASLDTMTRFADRDLGDTHVQEELALSHGTLGDLEEFADAKQPALAEFRLALAIYDRLTRRDPTNAGWQNGLGASHRAIGTALAALGDVDGAVAELRASIAVLGKAAAAGSTNSSLLHGILQARRTIVDLYLQSDHPTLALPEAREAIALSDRLLKLAPADKREQRTAELLHIHLGDALAATGDAKAGADELRGALAAAERLRTADPTNAFVRDDVGAAHRGLGQALHALGNDDEALVELRASLAISEARDKEHPGNSEVGARLISIHQLIAEVLLAASHPDAERVHAAIAELVAAQAIARHLIDAAPELAADDPLHKTAADIDAALATAQQLAQAAQPHRK